MYIIYVIFIDYYRISFSSMIFSARNLHRKSRDFPSQLGLMTPESKNSCFNDDDAAADDDDDIPLYSPLNPTKAPLSPIQPSFQSG